MAIDWPAFGETPWDVKVLAGLATLEAGLTRNGIHDVVAQHGAVSGGSTTTNATAFTEAVSAVTAEGGGTILVPPGDYDIGATTLVFGAHDIALVGFGRTATTLRCSGPFLTADDSDGSSVASMKIVNTTATNTDDGISVNAPRRWNVEGLRMEGFGGNSIRYGGGLHSWISRNHIIAQDSSATNGNAGICFEHDDDDVYCTTHVTDSNYIGAGVDYGIYHYDTAQMRSYNDIVEYCATAVKLVSASTVVLDNLYCEHNDLDIDSFDSVFTLIAGRHGTPTVTWSGQPVASRCWSDYGRNYLTTGSVTTTLGDLVSARTVRSQAAATGSRPSAVTMGAGAMWYDTTLAKPIWSNGTVWKDAAGTTV